MGGMTVTTAAALAAALKTAQAGDEFKCAPGTYATSYIQAHLPGVIISSVDPANPAFFPNLTVINGGGVAFRDIKTVNARVQNGKNVEFARCTFTGDMNKDDGLHIQGGSDSVSVRSCVFTQLFHAVQAGQSSNLSFVGNDFSDIRCDGIFWGQVQTLLIHKNRFRRWHLTGADHPDGMQGTPGVPGGVGSSDVTVTFNLVDGGNDPANPFQGQGLGAFTSGVVTNYVCEDNFLRNLLDAWAMMIAGAAGGSVQRNTILGTTRHRNVMGLPVNDTGLVVAGNVVTHSPVNVPASGYTLIPIPADGGDALLEAWKDAQVYGLAA